MTSDALHVVFSRLAASNLRRALALLERRDRVVGFMDDLSLGPINPPDPNWRAEWVNVHLRHTGWRAGFKDEATWTTVQQCQGPVVVWMSRRSTREYAGFLEFAHRFSDSPFELIDLTETIELGRSDEGTSVRPAGSLEYLSAEQILANDLLNQAHAVAPEMREIYRMAWQGLREESAALRVLDRDLNLMCAPITFFDQQLLSLARKGHWLKAARIVGEMLMAFDKDARHQTGDLVLTARLLALVESGLLESRGDLSRIRYSEVRLVGA